MPYKSKKDVPKTLKHLTLKQANYWVKVYDSVYEKTKDKEKSAKIAWTKTKEKYPSIKKKLNEQINTILLEYPHIIYNDLEPKKEKVFDFEFEKHSRDSLWNYLYYLENSFEKYNGVKDKYGDIITKNELLDILCQLINYFPDGFIRQINDLTEEEKDLYLFNFITFFKINMEELVSVLKIFINKTFKKE